MELFFRLFTKKSLWLCTLLFLQLMYGLAQQDTTEAGLKVSGYIEAYYNNAVYNGSNSVAAFIFNHSKPSTFAINLAIIKGSLSKKNYRAALALHGGTYVNANYEESLGSLRMINEAQIGLKLAKNDRLWLDVGIMPSHIGAESAIGQDNYTLTRSLMAELSPYYETGAKLTYDFGNGKGSAGILVCNGWQKISNDDQAAPAFGTLFNYNFNSSWALSYNTFYGKALTGLSSQLFNRFYNNVFLKYTKNNLNLMFCYDLGRQELSFNQKVQYWSAIAFIARYKVSKNTSLCYRIENFDDKYNSIPIDGTALKHTITGNSLNLDYAIAQEVLVRVEYKVLTASELLFTDNKYKTTNFLTIALCAKL